MLAKKPSVIHSQDDTAPSPLQVEETLSDPALDVLAGRLSTSLAPVEPSRGFVTGLKVRLAESHQLAVQEQERQARRMRAAIGTGLGAVIVIALLARLIGSIVMIVALIARLRRRTATT